MAQLTAGQKTKLRAALMRAWSNNRTPVAVNKTDLATLITLADTWRNSNAAAYNTALASVPGLTAAQKALLLTADLIAVYMVDNPAELAILNDLISQIMQEGVS